MHTKNRTKLTFLGMLATATVLACSVLGGSDPTATPLTAVDPTAPPAPTTVPEPTAAAVEPTAVSAEPTASIDTVVVGDELAIVATNSFLDYFDTFSVVGLVTNGTDRTVDNIEIEVELFDANGNSLYVDMTYADLFYLAPGETSPFTFRLFEDITGIDSYVATIVGQSSGEVERAFLDIENVSINIDDDEEVYISGEIFNNTGQPAEINDLAVALFDANGALLSADTFSVSVRYLDPGESGPFRIGVDGPVGISTALGSHQFYIDAEVSSPIAGSGIEISEATNYQDAFGNVHLVGELTNTGSDALNIRLVAGIYDGQGMVLDAAYFDIPMSALVPGQTTPYDFHFWGPLDYVDGVEDLAERYTIQVDGYWTWMPDVEIFPLAVGAGEVDYGQFDATATGSVTNNSGGPIDTIVTVITLRDTTTNEVVATGTDFYFADDELADGGAIDYEAYLSPPDGLDPTTVTVTVEAFGVRP
jgi:hypothetical protein